MKLVIIPDVDGDSFSIIDEKFPPESYIEIDSALFEDSYDFDDVKAMLRSFNK